jgi:hypothetical protein
MTQTIYSPAHPYGNTGFNGPTEEPTVALRPRRRFAPAPGVSPHPGWGQAPAAPNHYPGPIPQLAPQHSNPWGVPNTWGPPAPWAQPPAGGQSPKTQRWLLALAGAAAAVAAITVAVAASTARHNDSAAGPAGVQVPNPPTKSTAASAPSASAPVAPPSHAGLVSDEALPTLVPDPAYIGQIMGTTGLEPIDKLDGPGMFTDDADPAQCVGVIIPANKNVYVGAGSRAAYVQALHDQSRTTVFDGVTTFATSSLAGDFVTQQAPTWQACQSTPIVMDPSHDKPMSWTVQDVTRQGDTLTARVSVPGGPSCQRALTSKNNVVIDVTACNANPSNEAVTIASEIARRAAQ